MTAADGPAEVRITAWIWWLGRILLTPLFVLVFRIRTIGRQHIPATGGTLFVANHISLWDPPMIGCALASRRQVYFMAKSELFAIPVLGAVIRRGGAFPVVRGSADRAAFRTARDILLRGDALLMFPEGTRQDGGAIGAALPGAGALGLIDGIQVIPVRISGSNRRLGPVRVQIGAPIGFTDIDAAARGERNQRAADRMMAAIAALPGGPPQGAEGR